MFIVTKPCTKCGTIKSLTDYYASAKGKFGKASWCKLCTNTITRDRRRRVRANTPEQKRKWQLKTRYGLTPERFDEMWAEQNGLCALCDDDLATTKRVCVDHCHDTTRVRGLLCHRCNIRLGGWDDPTWRARAIPYMGVF